MAAKHSKKTAKKNIWLKLLLCISLIAGVTATTIGTHAWLYHEPTAEVVTLTGHNLAVNITNVGNSDLIPGNEYTKKPYVTVPGGTTSIDSWVFIKVTIPSTLTCSVDTGIWTLQETGYYYRAVTQSSSDQSFDILTNDKITVKTSVTSATAAQSFYVRACAVQRVGGLENDRAAAFALAKTVLDAS